MKITAEEKLMYQVMKSIFDSKIPISFKGSMVLKACLIEAGYFEETRHTVDIDANWNSDTPPTSEQMTKSLQSAIQNNGLDLDVNINRMYKEGRSAGFDLTNANTGELLFSMDIDVNRPIAKTQIYEVGGLRFRGVSPSQMIADKVFVISTDNVFRRIKDVVDIYYISNVFNFDKDDIMQTLKNSERRLGSFNGFIHKADELAYSYDKFRFAGDVNKPPFKEVYNAVNCFLKDIIPKEKHKELER